MPPYLIDEVQAYVFGYQTGNVSRTVAAPTHIDGDLLLLLAWQGISDQSSISLPSGWTEDARFSVSAEMSAVCAHRVAASEPANYTITFADVANVVMVSSWRDHAGIADFAATAGNGTHPPDYSTDPNGANPAATGAVAATEHGTLALLSGAIGIASTSAGIPVAFASNGGFFPSGGGLYQFPSGQGGRLVDTTPGSLGPYAFTTTGADIRGWAAGLWAIRPLAVGGWGVGQIRMGGN